MVIKRTVQAQIEKVFFKGRIIVIYGPRRVGKTTLLNELGKKYKNSTFLNCDEPDVAAALTGKTSAELKDYIGKAKVVFLDEAQRIRNIGLTLKLLIDNYPDIQIVATGSSSFELSNKVIEPLTGRKYEFYLYPFSIEEVLRFKSYSDLDRLLNTRIVYGMYPDVFKDNPQEVLKELTKSYLFRDAFQFQSIKNPDILEKLLTALALQIGNEVSYTELANLVEIDKKTVIRYIQILERAFIIFRLRPYSKNLRKEISKLRKIYFWDVGVRNALIKNLNPIELRQDVGALWENFIISERVKYDNNHRIDKNYYFWRTHRKEEIDFLEELGGEISAYEIKWNTQKFKVPKAFADNYKDIPVKLVNRMNYRSWLLGMQAKEQ